MALDARLFTLALNSPRAPFPLPLPPTNPPHPPHPTHTPNSLTSPNLGTYLGSLTALASSMTKFDGDALGVRGRATGAVTGADRRRELEEWRKTGRHPELVAAAAAAAATDRPLPPPVPDRPHVYLQFGSIRLVYEVYDDVAPRAGRVLLAAVDAGSAGGAEVTHVDAGVAATLTLPSPADGVPRPPPSPGATETTIQHMGLVLSVSRDDSQSMLLTLQPRTRAFDASHAPAARLVHGDVEAVAKVGMRVTGAGRTAARDAHAWDEEAAAAITAATAAADPAAVSQATRDAVDDAVAESLAAKRGREGEEGKEGGVKKKTMLDAALGVSDGDSDGESD